MSTWDYRVIRTVGGKGTTRYYNYGIGEVYYDKRGKVVGWTDNEARPAGESPAELRRDLALMRQALTRPVLEEHEGELREVENSARRAEKGKVSK